MSPAVPARLRSSRDVVTTRRTGTKVVGPHVVLWYRDRGDGHGVRATAVASRAAGNAVSRNRAKRCLREASRAVSWTGDLDVVLQARSTTAAAGTNLLTDELVRIAPVAAR